MKKNEIIELNGEEYTLELNRDSFLKIDQYCNIEKSLNVIYKQPYEYIENIKEDEDPFADVEEIDNNFKNEVEEKEKVSKKLIEVALWIWLYPNYKFSISKVREMVLPYWEDTKKLEELSEKIGEYLQQCVNIRESYNEELKNLKAQINKK